MPAMFPRRITLAAFALSMAACATSKGESISPELAWLEQITGNWTYEAELQVDPDQPPMKGSGTERGRMDGNKAILEGRQEGMTTEFTILFDPATKVFSARFTASTMPTPWTYEGTLDEAGKILTLNSKGPSPHNPKEQLNYRTFIEVKDGDHKTVHSSVEMDGKWITFETYRYRRAR